MDISKIDDYHIHIPTKIADQKRFFFRVTNSSKFLFFEPDFLKGRLSFWMRAT